MKRKNWPLLALAASESGRLTPLQVQKALFLLGQELGAVVDDDYYHFVPYHYGPFDTAIYQDLEDLVDAGLVQKVRSEHHTGKDYELTDAGHKKVTSLKRDVPHNAMDYLRDAVEWMKPLSFSQVVSAIYRKYPKFRVNSVFRG